MNNHVTSKEISEKLKSLGVKQESLFWWDDDGKLCIGGEERMGNTLYPETMSGGIYSILSAFLCSELGEMLPIECDYYKPANGTVARDCGKWVVYWEPTDYKYHKIYADTEADARGKMLIYLLENGLITLKQ